MIPPSRPRFEALDTSDPRYPVRYGLPFLGDNAFLLDKIKIHDEPVHAHWYRPLAQEDESEAVPRSTRLTVWIDRQDMSKTRSVLFAPGINEKDEAANPDWAAWTRIVPPQKPEPPSKASRKKGSP